MAIIDEGAIVDKTAKVWGNAHIRDGAMIGYNVIIGEGVYIGRNVVIGDNCKIQNHALVYEGSIIGDGVFIGPGTILCNDKIPRAILPDGTQKTSLDWNCTGVRIEYGASIGAGAIILPGVTIGAWAMVAAGAVVTQHVLSHILVVGNPARRSGFVCKAGHRLCNLYCSLCDWRLGND